MRNREAAFMVTARQIKQYEAYLQEQERAGNTVRKYVHDLNAMLAFLDGRPLTKAALIAWKEQLVFPLHSQFHADGGQWLFGVYGPPGVCRAAAESAKNAVPG